MTNLKRLGRYLKKRPHCLKVSSHTQSTISLSSGESEYYGIVAIGLGARSMLQDFGMCADVVDSNEYSRETFA